MGGVASPAQPDLRPFVLEDQDRRLAAQALRTAGDELVGHEIGQDEDAPAPEGPDEGRQAVRSAVPRSVPPTFRDGHARALGQDPLHRLEQVLGHEVGRPRPLRAVVLELPPAIAALDEGAARARPEGQLQVPVAVADHPRPREVGAQLGLGPLQEARPRLAAVAVLPVGRLAHARVVRTEEDAVEVRAARLDRSAAARRGPRG